MMFKQECQEIAQELISVTAIMLSKAKPDKAYSEMVRGLVEYGGMNWARQNAWRIS